MGEIAPCDAKSLELAIFLFIDSCQLQVLEKRWWKKPWERNKICVKIGKINRFTLVGNQCSTENVRQNKDSKFCPYPYMNEKSTNGQIFCYLSVVLIAVLG